MQGLGGVPLDPMDVARGTAHLVDTEHRARIGRQALALRLKRASFDKYCRQDSRQCDQ